MLQEDGPRAVEIDLGHGMVTIGGGLLLMDEHGCHVLVPDRDGSGVLDVTFVACTQSVFGYPNDEAQEGHPLARGLAYGVYEVLGSDWAQRLEQQNRVRFPEVRWQPKRHFLMLMHESMGEFLADDVRVGFHPGTLSTGVFDHIAHQVLQQALDADVPTMLPHREIDPA
ncbi:hypothetical protein [Streptomyces sp. NPDC001068]|uniref:hypothetical protein n=1 Tax=Streptomyces sp. NPDC001068 TaxID=3364544 RepID=UPI003673EBAE